MDMKYIFFFFCIWLMLNISQLATTELYPRITEPKKNTTLQVLPGSNIDLYCSADLGDVVSVEYTMIYWIIHGNFTDYYDKVQESNTIVHKEGNFTRINLILHLFEVAEEFYNVPITCILQTASGNDTSTLYFTSLKTDHWTVGIPVALIVFCLLVVFACIHCRTVTNAAH